MLLLQNTHCSQYIFKYAFQERGLNPKTLLQVKLLTHTELLCSVWVVVVIDIVTQKIFAFSFLKLVLSQNLLQSSSYGIFPDSFDHHIVSASNFMKRYLAPLLKLSYHLSWFGRP